MIIKTFAPVAPGLLLLLLPGPLHGTALAAKLAKTNPARSPKHTCDKCYYPYQTPINI
jgi:hypothetical protein